MRNTFWSGSLECFAGIDACVAIPGAVPSLIFVMFMLI